MSHISPRIGCRALLDSLYDAVLITDLNGRIVGFNARAPEMLGGRAGGLSGRFLADLIGGTREDFLPVILRKLEASHHVLVEAMLLRNDSAGFPAELAVSRVTSRGSPRLCFCVRDITLRKAAQTAITEAAARIEEHDKGRLQFISNVSHELRTPLTSMIYAVNNMLAGVVGPVPDRARHYLEILEGDCKRLLATVNDILDLRKLESRTMALTRRRVPLMRLVQRSAESLRVQAQQKSLSLNIVPARERLFIDCDAQKMERVILNVVGNAVKFTPEGGRVEVSVGGDPQRPGHALISVRDDGIGIPAEALSKVALRYFTVGAQATGSGLGLAISREIVALHGGQLLIQSPPTGFDKGTAVRISLLAVAPPAVLVVDDDPGILELLAEQIGAEGYRVLRSGSGRGALATVARESPAAIVLDLVLPDTDGAELVLKLRSEKQTSATGIIVVTGAAISRTKEEILGNFSIPTLGKPWDEGELLDRLADVFLGTSTLGGR